MAPATPLAAPATIPSTPPRNARDLSRGPGSTTIPVLPPDVDRAHFDRIFETNVKGAVCTVQRAQPLLRQGACFVFNTSVTANLGCPLGSAYGASKAALTSLTRTLASVLLEQGVRVNAVAPGPTAYELAKIGILAQKGGALAKE